MDPWSISAGAVQQGPYEEDSQDSDDAHASLVDPYSAHTSSDAPNWLRTSPLEGAAVRTTQPQRPLLVNGTQAHQKAFTQGASKICIGNTTSPGIQEPPDVLGLVKLSSGENSDHGGDRNPAPSTSLSLHTMSDTPDVGHPSFYQRSLIVHKKLGDFAWLIALLDTGSHHNLMTVSAAKRSGVMGTLVMYPEFKNINALGVCPIQIAGKVKVEFDVSGHSEGLKLRLWFDLVEDRFVNEAWDCILSVKVCRIHFYDEKDAPNRAREQDQASPVVEPSWWRGERGQVW